MSDLNIRPATLADADTIAQFNQAMAVETEGRRLDDAVLADGVRTILRDDRHGVYWIAQRDGQPVGQMLITYEYSDWRNGLFWWIQSVYVPPAERGRGVYRALHAWVEWQARQATGVIGLRLYVEASNTSAQEVYRKMGMRETSYRLYETDWSGAPGH